MTQTQLPGNTEQKSELETCIEAVLATPEGIQFFRYLCDLTGYLKTSIFQNANQEIQTEVMVGLEANRKLWLMLRGFIADDKLIQIEIMNRKRKIEVVDNTRTRIEEWQKAQLQAMNQTPEWDNKIPGA